MAPRSARSVASDGDRQRAANDEIWQRGDLVKAYANRTLRPVEVVLLVRYRDALSGDVLELGCGAGRLTGYLIEIARTVQGIDLAPAMVDYCRRRYPGGMFRVGDLREIATVEPASFDAIVAPFNVLDVLGDAERASVLDGIHDALPTGGTLIMSTHNLAFAPRLASPYDLRHLGPLGFVSTLSLLPRRLRNRRRNRPFERMEPGYAILNDIAHDYSLLHYYITRDDQERQLNAHGFTLVECLDLEGHTVPQGANAAACPELHYVARRTADGSVVP